MLCYFYAVNTQEAFSFFSLSKNCGEGISFFLLPFGGTYQNYEDELTDHIYFVRELGYGSSDTDI